MIAGKRQLLEEYDLHKVGEHWLEEITTRGRTKPHVCVLRSALLKYEAKYTQVERNNHIYTPRIGTISYSDTWTK